MYANEVPKEDIDRCVELLSDLQADRGDASDCLAQIKPVVLALSNGRTLFERVEQLVQTGDAEKAARLISHSKRTKSFLGF